MKKIKFCIFLMVLIWCSNLYATITLLDFEGLDNSEEIQNFYNGGVSQNGNSGIDYGVTFSSNTLSLIDSDAGGSGNFGGEPSPDTVMIFTSGTESTMTVEDGFDIGFSFYYSAPSTPGSVEVFDGPNGTGNVLAILELPITPSDGGDPNGSYSPFVPIGVSFNGTAKSVSFIGVASNIGFDNITFGSSSAQRSSDLSFLPAIYSLLFQPSPAPLVNTQALWNQIIQKARVGDILLFGHDQNCTEEDNCYDNSSIWGFSYGYYSHAAIITTVNTELNKLVIFHAKGPGYPDEDEVSKDVLDNQILESSSTGILALIRVKNVDDSTAELVAENAVVKYDSWTYADLLVSPYYDPYETYCSKLVRDAYQDLGFYIGDQDKFNEGSYITKTFFTPDEISQSNNIDYISTWWNTP